jgi:hypothetical protein
MTSDAAIRREKLKLIDEIGSTEGINPRSLERFWNKGYLSQDGPRVTLTKKGRAVMAGNIGRAGRGAVDFDTANRAATKAGGHNTARGHAARAQALLGSGEHAETKREREEQLARMFKEHEAELATEKKTLDKIIGTYAVTIAPSDGSTMNAGHIADFRENGWIIAAAPTAPARLGSRLPGSRREQYDQETYYNPSDPLGPMGEARAVILRTETPLDLDTLSTIRQHGFDLTPAPAKMRQRPPMTKNPSPAKKAAKKAAAWYGNTALETEPRVLRGYNAPEAAVEIGDFVAIEYDSNKFDGTSRIYRHEGTRKRKMYLSVDGSTIIIWPPFKITKRGIEG